MKPKKKHLETEHSDSFPPSFVIVVIKNSNCLIDIPPFVMFILSGSSAHQTGGCSGIKGAHNDGRAGPNQINESTNQTNPSLLQEE